MHRQCDSNVEYIRWEGDAVSQVHLSSYSFIYWATWMETFSEKFSFQGLIKEIHFKEGWTWEEKRYVRAEGQCYTGMVVQVFQVEENREMQRASSCRRYLYREQVFSRHCARDLYWLTDPSRCTLNPLTHSPLPAQSVSPRTGREAYPISGLPHLLAGKRVGQGRVLTRYVWSGRKVRSRYLLFA